MVRKKSNNNKIARYIFVALGILFLAVLIYLGLEKEEEQVFDSQEINMEEVLKKLTAPGPGEPVPDEVLKKLTAPGPGEPVPDEVLKKLTAPVR